MNDNTVEIKKLITYLTNVYRDRKIERQEPDFFKLTKDLDDMLHK